jgi:SpoVK/Ycf46/Vps4 family AAA+-type ATPase
MEHFDGITVLATNLRGNLDQAFLRRMQFIVHFPDPDPETRRRLWAEHLKQAGEQSQDDPVNVDLLAECIELAGGDIRNIVLAAAYDAAVTNGPVTHSIVVASALREYQKLGRRIPPRLGATGGNEQIPSYIRRR